MNQDANYDKFQAELSIKWLDLTSRSARPSLFREIALLFVEKKTAIRPFDLQEIEYKEFRGKIYGIPEISKEETQLFKPVRYQRYGARR